MPLPFTDTFAGTNGDAWASGKWTTSEEGSSSANTDIQSNEGRMQAGTSQDDFSAATAHSDTDIQDAEVELEIEMGSPGGSAKWIYVMLRSSGEQVAANAGRPATAYYVRLNADATDAPAGAILYRRVGNSETSLDSTLGLSHTGNEAYFLKMQVEDSGSNVIIRGRSWDSTDAEGGGWDFEYTDSSPGAIHGVTGKLQLVARQFSGTEQVDVRIDNVTFVNLAAAVKKQDGYRFYADDAAVGSETALANEDTNITKSKESPFRLRIQTDVAGDADAEAMTLQYKEVGDGSGEWRNVPLP